MKKPGKRGKEKAGKKKKKKSGMKRARKLSKRMRLGSVKNFFRVK